MLWLWILLSVIGSIILILTIIAAIKKPASVYKNRPDQQNPMQGKKVVFIEDETEKANADGVKGHLEAVGKTEHKAVLKPGEMTVQKDRIVFYDPEHIEIYSRLSDELTGRKEESGK